VVGPRVGVAGGEPGHGSGRKAGGLTAKGAKTAKGTATATASHAKAQSRKELRLATESTEGHGRERGRTGCVVGGEPLACMGMEGGKRQAIARGGA